MSVTSQVSRAPAPPLVTLVFISRLIPLLAAPVTLWLIATQRPIAEQGAYFIFINTQAIAQTVEIGLGTLIVQFVSHESAGLTWGAGGAFDGDVAAMRRVGMIVTAASRWYARLAVAFAAIAMPLGLALFTSRGVYGWWEAAWWVTTVAFTALSFTLVPTLAALEGSGRLAQVQRMRLVQVAASLLALWIGLLAVDALCGVAAFAVTWFAVQVTWLSRTHRGLIANAMRRAGHADTDLSLSSLTGRLLRAQRHGAVMWLALWVAPQVLVPCVLLADGPAAAGRIGMSLAIATAPVMLASAWLYSRYPRYGALVARGATRELAQLARRATAEAVVVCLVGAVAGAVALALLARIAPSLADRAMSPTVTLALGVGNSGWLVIQGVTSYVRAWRGEPLAYVTAIGAALVMGTTLLVAVLHGQAGTIALAYAGAVLVGATPTTLTFWRRRPDLQV
jgi:hypothetical protein